MCHRPLTAPYHLPLAAAGVRASLQQVYGELTEASLDLYSDAAAGETRGSTPLGGASTPGGGAALASSPPGTSQAHHAPYADVPAANSRAGGPLQHGAAAAGTAAGVVAAAPTAQQAPTYTSVASQTWRKLLLACTMCHAILQVPCCAMVPCA